MRRNNIRLAKVWMDDYEELYYNFTRPNNGEDAGDFTERTELRKQLRCKSFKWYLDTVYPDVFKPWESIATGEIRSKNETGKCLDGPKTTVVNLQQCHGLRGNQLWFVTDRGEIRTKSEQCLDSTGQKENPENVVTYGCHGSKGNQWWEFTNESAIVHRSHKLCLEARGDDVLLSDCVAGKLSQQWQVENWRPSMIAH